MENKLVKLCKKFLCAVLATFLCVLISSSPSFAQKVRVGIFDGSNYYGVDENGLPYGYGYELLELIAGYAGFEYEFVRGSWADCLVRLEVGEIDLLDSVIRTPMRERMYDFSEYPTGMSFCKVFSRKDDMRIEYNNFRAFDGKIIGMLRGNAQNDVFKEHISRLPIKTVNLEYPDEESMSAALLSGEVDAVVSNNMRRDKDERAVARIAPRQFFLTTPKEEPDLMTKINNAIAQLLTENPGFISDLSKKYNLYDVSALILTDEERNFIKNSKPITVVYGSFWPPFESFDEEKGTAVGINADILRIISEKTGIRFDFLNGYSYEQSIEMVSKGEADMLLSYDTNAKMAQKLHFILSDTFISTPVSIIGIKQTIDERSVFAVSRLLPVIEGYVREVFPKNKIVLYDDITACYEAIERGDANFTLENTYAGGEAIRGGEYGDLKIVTVTTLMDNFSFAFKSGINRNLLNIFNKAIRTILQGDREKILFEYSISNAEKVSVRVFYERYKTYLWLGVVAIMCVFAFIQIQKKKELWRAAYIDTLTGAGNAAKLMMDAERLLRANRDRPYIAVKIDIDRFKFLNEIYGVEGGDQILKNIALSIKGMLNSRYETFARVGSDEFVVLLSCGTTEEVDERRREFENNFYNVYGNGKMGQVKFPTGRYCVDRGSVDVHKMLENVNYAHRIAKQRGILNYDYDEATKASAMRLHEIECKMEAALKNREFIMFLQPKYGIADDTIAGGEALVRWKDAEGVDLVYPDSFIPLFEKNGFIIKLDMYMLERVCETIISWIDNDIPPTTISVNFSRLHLVNHPSFLEDVCAVVDKHGVPRELIEVEFTESTMFGSEKVFVEMFEKLHGAGFTLSMDDFGTGYSSLGLLKDIPVDVVKMDKSFFTSARDMERTKIIVSNVIIMAHNLDIRTVAEGVESADQIELLRAVGCDIVQGYFYSRPLTEADFTARMKASDKRSFLEWKKEG